MTEDYDRLWKRWRSILSPTAMKPIIIRRTSENTAGASAITSARINQGMPDSMYIMQATLCILDFSWSACRISYLYPQGICGLSRLWETYWWNSLGSILRLINYVFRMAHRERDYVERSFLIKNVMNMINNVIYFYCVLL